MDPKPTLAQSLSLLDGIKVRRLLQEEPGVKGCAWFGKNPDSPWHVPANFLRVLFAIVFAPLFVTLSHIATVKIDKFLQKIAWSFEFPDTPNALLYSSSAGGLGQYEVTSYRPQWMLKVQFRNGQQPKYDQVPWSPKLHKNKYTAISYSMDSAFELFREAGLHAYDPQPSPTRRWSLRDRKRISECLLFEYAKARERLGRPDGIEHVWLDEFCLSDEALVGERVAGVLRREELGRIPDQAITSISYIKCTVVTAYT